MRGRRLNTPFSRILLFVVFAHLLVLSYLHFQPPSTTPQQTKRKIQVAKTIELVPQKPVAAKSPQKPSSQVSSISKPPPSKPTSEAKTEVASTKPPPSNSSSKKKTEVASTKPPPLKPSTKAKTVVASTKPPSPKSPNMQNKLEEAKKNLAKFTKETTSSKSDSSQSKKETSNSFPDIEVASFGEWSAHSCSFYADQLVLELKRILNLPERGEVDLELTLRRDGSVLSVKVLAAKSSRNRQIVTQNLTNIHFSPFDDSFGTASEHTFHLLLKNS